MKIVTMLEASATKSMEKWMTGHTVSEPTVRKGQWVLFGERKMKHTSSNSCVERLMTRLRASSNQTSKKLVC